MNLLLRKIVGEIIVSLSRYSWVVGIITYGSIGRGDEDQYSDIDMGIYIQDYNDEKVSTVDSNIRNIFVKIEDGVLHSFKKHDKYIYISRKNNIILEAKIKEFNRIDEDIIYIIQSHIDPPTNAITYDPKGVMGKFISRFSFNLNVKSYLEHELDEIINSIIYYFNLYLLYRRRKDCYRAYMNYSITMFKLASLIALSHGSFYNLYGPWFLCERIIINEKIRDLFCSMLHVFDKPIDYIYDSLIEIVMKSCNLIKNNIKIKCNDKLLIDVLSSLIAKYEFL